MGAAGQAAGAGGRAADQRHLHRAGRGRDVAGEPLGDGAVRGTLFFYVMRTYVRFAVGILAAVLTVFLVVDFVDRARAYTGEGWVWDVMRLYANKALVATQQLGPAALLLAAGVDGVLAAQAGRGDGPAGADVRARGALRAHRAVRAGGVPGAHRLRREGGGDGEPAGGRDQHPALQPVGRLAALLHAEAVVPAGRARLLPPVGQRGGGLPGRGHPDADSAVQAVAPPGRGGHVPAGGHALAAHGRGGALVPSGWAHRGADAGGGGV